MFYDKEGPKYSITIPKGHDSIKQEEAEENYSIYMRSAVC